MTPIDPFVPWKAHHIHSQRYIPFLFFHTTLSKLIWQSAGQCSKVFCLLMWTEAASVCRNIQYSI